MTATMGKEFARNKRSIACNSVPAFHAQRSGDGQFSDVVYAVVCPVGVLQPDNRMSRAVGGAPSSDIHGRAVVGRWATTCPEFTTAVGRIEVLQTPVSNQVPQWFVVFGTTRCIAER